MRRIFLYYSGKFEYVLLPRHSVLANIGTPATKNVTETICGAPVRDKTRVVFDVASIFGSIALFVVLLRFISKTPFVGGIWGWDDFWMLLTTTVMIPYAVINMASTYLRLLCVSY